jgi:glycosyltransferase involved in cell wall biosynthesis
VRILYFYPSHHFNSGSPKVLVAMIDALDRERYEPLFWATGEGPLTDELTRRGVALLRGPAGAVSRRHPVAALRRVVAQARTLRRAGIDLLHVNEYSWNLDLVLGAKLARIPVILHAHNPVNVERWNLDRWLADRILFVSETHRRETAHLDRLGSRTVVLHNPLDLDQYAGGHSVRPAVGLQDDDIVLLTVGQIEPRKGIDVALEVMRRLAPACSRLRLLVAGPVKSGHDAFAEAVMAQARIPPLAGKVQFLGGRSDIPDLLASADIFFLASHHETFGLVVGEAMAASLPVVTTDVGGIPEVVGEPDAAVMLPVGDLDAFTAAVERLVREADERRALGARGRRSVEQRFGRAAFARDLEAIYRELLC